jgi:hypothetical protein
MNDRTYLRSLSGDWSDKANSDFWKALRSYETETQIRVVGRIVPNLPRTPGGDEARRELFQFAFQELAETEKVEFAQPFEIKEFTRQSLEQLGWGNFERVRHAFVVIRCLNLDRDNPLVAEAMGKAARSLLEDGYVCEHNILYFLEKKINLLTLAETPED